LYCYKNKISSLPPSIGHIGTLQILSISNNKLTKLPDEIGGLEQLLELYVGGKNNETFQCTETFQFTRTFVVGVVVLTNFFNFFFFF
jgi:Leucine-rich repeat (LRR) protein